jgi:hypothetical protein
VASEGGYYFNKNSFATVMITSMPYYVSKQQRIVFAFLAELGIWQLQWNYCMSEFCPNQMNSCSMGSIDLSLMLSAPASALVPFVLD